MVVPIVNPYAKKRRDNSGHSTNVGHVDTQNNVDTPIIQQQNNSRSQQASNCCTTTNNHRNSNTSLVVAAPLATTTRDPVDDRENRRNRENRRTSIPTVVPNVATMGIQSQKRNGQREKKENLNIRNTRRSNR